MPALVSAFAFAAAAVVVVAVVVAVVVVVALVLVFVLVLVVFVVVVVVVLVLVVVVAFYGLHSLCEFSTLALLRSDCCKLYTQTSVPHCENVRDSASAF